MLTCCPEYAIFTFEVDFPWCDVKKSNFIQLWLSFIALSSLRYERWNYREKQLIQDDSSCSRHFALGESVARDEDYCICFWYKNIKKLYRGTRGSTILKFQSHTCKLNIFVNDVKIISAQYLGYLGQIEGLGDV